MIHGQRCIRRSDSLVVRVLKKGGQQSDARRSPMARILVVDDEVLVRRTVKTILERIGHTAVLAECGHDGAVAIEAYAFDIAVVDIFKPGMEGLETIRVFRHSAPKLPIIAISGYAFREVGGPAPDFLRMAVGLGATAYLRKPFTAAELVNAVQACDVPRSCNAAKPHASMTILGAVRPAAPTPI
jgi:two-component system response regulator (stage 0 sporulation protein F)